MATSEQFFSLVRTGSSSWAAVPTHRAEQATDKISNVREIEPKSAEFLNPDVTSIFSESAEKPEAFAERYPRLTIAMISFLLFAVSVTAEVECMRQAGYTWH